MKVGRVVEVLTPRRKAVLKAIVWYSTVQAYGPTIAELANHLDVLENTIVHHIKVLRRAGYLCHYPKGTPRGLKVSQKGLEALHHGKFRKAFFRKRG